MFDDIRSKYALKKALAHKLKKYGFQRLGWDLESERSYHFKNGNYELVPIYDAAIEKQKEL